MATASCVRDVTSSFWKICRRCVSTVFVVTNSRPAISRLVRPVATSRATFRSCGVSPSAVDGTRRRTEIPVASSSARARSPHACAPMDSNASRAAVSVVRASTRFPRRRSMLPRQSCVRAASYGLAPAKCMSTAVRRSSIEILCKAAAPKGERLRALEARSLGDGLILPRDRDRITGPTGPHQGLDERRDERGRGDGVRAKTVLVGDVGEHDRGRDVGPSERELEHPEPHPSREPGPRSITQFRRPSAVSTAVRLPAKQRLDPCDSGCRAALLAELTKRRDKVELIGGGVERIEQPAASGIGKRQEFEALRQRR